MSETILGRISRARENLENAVDNVLGDLGTLGRAKAGEILCEIQDELDGIEELAVAAGNA